MANKKAYFNSINTRVSFPKLEEDILKFWDKNKTFEKSTKKNKGGKPFVFYDGPPTANGKPHIGHVITRAFKDVFPRFKTMQGFQAVRKAGWDTHGLPVEVEVEKQLGISGKEEIENLVKGDKAASVAKFNEECRKSVWKYVDLWEKMVNRVGHWIDLKDAYVTYENDYIESVWWSLKKLFEDDLLYLGYKVVPYCTRCGTPLSSHELSQDYKEVKDPSIYPKFKLIGEKDTYLLAWTTTPWTLPGNVALAVDSKVDYVYLELEGETLILASAAVDSLKLKGKILKKVKGRQLVGKKYEPLYDYLSKRYPKSKFLHTIVEADFIDIKDGSGIVHTAVMYGVDDFDLGKRLGLPMYHLVDQKGNFTDDATMFSGKHVKKADGDIIKDLKKRNLLFRSEKVLHKYPFCWRCHEPLIYYALESWFIKTTKFKKELLENNKNTNWVPQKIRDGRMKNWYETLVDWSLSRNRYWGAPLPVWMCEKCDHKKAIGSIAELKSHAKEDHDWEKFDLHRPYVDGVTFDCEKCKSVMRRTPEVIDVWYESGAMPFAQFNSPHKNEEKFKQLFPADYVTEAIDQTRGWFFSLQAVNTLIFGKSPYKNVVVFEHALDPKGKKMSKHIGNVVDPWEAFDKYGADATRWFFFSSVSIGTQYKVSVDTIGQVLKGFLLPLWNTYNFFTTYANLDGWTPKKSTPKPGSSQNVLDTWILARLNQLVGVVTDSLEDFDTFKSSRAIEEFLVKDLSQWYIRRSRDRIGPTVTRTAAKQEFYDTGYFVLVTLLQLLAPFTPFITEKIYKDLTKEESVHLSDWPSHTKLSQQELGLIKSMTQIREIVEKAHAIRKEMQIPVRQPLSSISVASFNEKPSEKLLKVLQDEINVKRVEWTKAKELSVDLDIKITDELKEEADSRQLVRKIQMERRKLKMSLTTHATVANPWLPKDRGLVEWIKTKTLAKSLKKGKFSVTKA